MTSSALELVGSGVADLSIRQVAERTGLSIHTLRYYERAGLISSVKRAANGHRRYSENDLIWLEFLKRLRATGMPTSQMKRFAELRRQGDASKAERIALLKTHYLSVENQIDELSNNLGAIREKIKRLSGASPEKVR